MSLRHLYKWKRLHCPSLLGLFNEFNDSDEARLDKHIHIEEPDEQESEPQTSWLNKEEAKAKHAEEAANVDSKALFVSKCREWMKKYNVKPGMSFGQLPKHMHQTWIGMDCDALALAGKLQGAPGGGGAAAAAAMGEEEFLRVSRDLIVDKCRRIERGHRLDVNQQGWEGTLPKGTLKEWRQMHCIDRLAEAQIHGRPTADCRNAAGHQGWEGGNEAPALPWVAVAVSATTRNLDVGALGLGGLALFSILLPSLVQAAECGFNYRVVLAYDYGDKFFDSKKGQQQTKEWFKQNAMIPLGDKGIKIELLFAPVDNKVKKPGPAFTAMTKVAYDAGSEYIYRVNDDTQFMEPFAALMSRALQAMGPPYGVVGPRCHGQSTRILTHDFTHRTHMEIFNQFYYPPQLSDWWMDDWVSRVYGRERTAMASSGGKVFHHTGKHGSRYQVDMSHKKFLEGLVKEGHKKIVGYAEQKGLLSGKALQQLRDDSLSGKSFKTI